MSDDGIKLVDEPLDQQLKELPVKIKRKKIARKRRRIPPSSSSPSNDDIFVLDTEFETDSEISERQKMAKQRRRKKQNQVKILQPIIVQLSHEDFKTLDTQRTNISSQIQNLITENQQGQLKPELIIYQAVPRSMTTLGLQTQQQQQQSELRFSKRQKKKQNMLTTDRRQNNPQLSKQKTPNLAMSSPSTTSQDS